MEVITKNAASTKRLGQAVGSWLTSYAAKKPVVLALVGELGSGKTTFVQGLAGAFGVTQRVISPTFILLRSYNNLHHLDLYRLGKGNIKGELVNIGFFDLVKQRQTVVVVEWAEKAKRFLPSNALWVKFKTDGNRRKIELDEKIKI